MHDLSPRLQHNQPQDKIAFYRNNAKSGYTSKINFFNEQDTQPTPSPLKGKNNFMLFGPQQTTRYNEGFLPKESKLSKGQTPKALKAKLWGETENEASTSNNLDYCLDLKFDP